MLVPSDPHSMAGFILRHARVVSSRKRDWQHVASPHVSQTRDNEEGHAGCRILRQSHFENYTGLVEGATLSHLDPCAGTGIYLC